MANKRLEFVSRDSNDELEITGVKEISQRGKMYTCEDNVVEKMGTSEDDGACGDSLSSEKKREMN